MKKTILTITALTLLLSGAMTMTSCGEDDPIKPETENQDPDPKPNDTVLDEGAQKERLSQIAKKMMNKVNTQQFDDVYAIMEAINDKVDDTNSEVLEDWWDAAIDACTLEDIDESGYDENGKYTSIYRLHCLWAASNFTDEIELVGNTWKIRSKSDCLTIKMKDNDNQTVTLTITPSGKETHLTYDEFNYEYYEDSYWGYYEESEIHELMVPEKVTIKLTRGSKTIVQSTITTKLKIQNSEGEFSPENDSFEVSTNVEICGYNIISDASYNNGKKATASTRLVLNDEELVRFKMDANGNVRDELEDSDGNGSASVSILNGELILDGSLNDVAAWIDLWDYYEEENEAKNAAMKFNNTSDIKLYFDNSKNPSAKLEFMAFKEEYDYGYGNEYIEWEIQPVVRFSDGSTYAVMDDYFSETYFKNIINQFEDLIEDFEEKYEEIE